MGRARTKRLLITATVIILFGIVGFGLCYGARLIAIGTAYKAKMLCSEVFVAGRDINAVLDDLVVDDLAVLRFIDFSIDSSYRIVTTSLFGLFESKVRYRSNYGCAFAPDALIPTSWEVNTLIRHPEKNVSLQPTEIIQSNHTSYPQLASVLDDAFSEPASDYLRRTRAIIIVHKGRIVAERYAHGIDADTPLPGWSMTKSVMNALVGILVKEGRFTLDTQIRAEVWRGLEDPRRFITLGHLLHMKSGLAFNEDMSDPLADVSRMILREQDIAAFAANKMLEAEPGTRWQYSSGTTNILSGFLRRVLSDDIYHRFPREALFDRLGMTDAVLEADASGTFVGSSYMYATAREWARFGLLYLQDGVWEGERILPVGWVQYTRTQVPAVSQVAYGAHFWLRIPKQYRGTNSIVPEDAFHAVGHEAQFVTIVPSHDTVIVRLGKTRYPQAWKHDVFVSNVLIALSEAR